MSELIYLPEFDDFIFTCSEQVRIEVFSTEYNISVSFKESVHSMSVIVHEFGCCAVGNQQKQVGLPCFRKLDVNDLVVVSNYNIFTTQAATIYDMHVLLCRNNDKFILLLPS